ncbi:oligosaccharyl transferase subunit ost3/OST6 [Coemansia sp. RSA 552]|nr:oligosaccharyl transferase subunit ost3/OST6 [Coemansia sp. RSA 552]
MRLLSVVLGLGLGVAGLAAAQSFEKIQEIGAQDRDGVAQLQMSEFIENVVPEDKDYAVIVQMTALAPAYKCEVCQVVDSSLRAVARGWRKQGGGAGKRRIAFGTLDGEVAEQLFRQMGIDKVPRLMIFPPSKGPGALANASPRELKLGERSSSAEGMAARLSELLGTEIRADLPVDYTKYAVNTAAVGGAGYAAVFAYRRINLRALGRNVWAAATIVFTLLMTSGLMWNRISAPPFMGQTRSGDAVLFAPTNSQQYGVETQIVATAYAACALCVVLLVRHVPQVAGGEQRTLVTFLVVGSLVLLFSYINSVFRLKMPGYPYRLLLP